MEDFKAVHFGTATTGPSGRFRGTFLLRRLHWVEQYRTAFEHFEHQNLLEQIRDGEDATFGQIGYGPHNSKTIVYQIIRSPSREHPHWKRQEM